MMNGARWYASWLREVDRLTAQKSGCAWVFNSWRSFPILARAAYEAAWPIESLLVWDKGPEVGMGGLRGLRAGYELAALFVQPDFKIANRSTKDIWNVPWGGSAPRAHHPAEKPAALMIRAIEVSGRIEPILDPFCGSGTTLTASKELGVPIIGIEIEPKYCEIAVKRLRQEVLL